MQRRSVDHAGRLRDAEGVRPDPRPWLRPVDRVRRVGERRVRGVADPARGRPGEDPAALEYGFDAEHDLARVVEDEAREPARVSFGLDPGQRLLADEPAGPAELDAEAEP